jgi:hypothetical protein
VRLSSRVCAAPDAPREQPLLSHFQTVARSHFQLQRRVPEDKICAKAAMNKRAIWLLLAPVLSACGDTSQSQIPISQPTPVTSAPAPAATGNRLSGMVIERTSSGGHAVPGGTVLFWPADGSPNTVPVSAEGQYVIPDVQLGALVRLVWFPPGNQNFHQPSPMNVTIVGSETHRDIEVARVDVRDFRCQSPILSGTVFETTAEGRQVIGQTRVLYSFDSRGFDAYTNTDAQGRYAFCDVRTGSGRVGAGDCNDAFFFVSADVTGDTSVDVDLTAFYASCPGAVVR